VREESRGYKVQWDHKAIPVCRGLLVCRGQGDLLVLKVLKVRQGYKGKSVQPVCRDHRALKDPKGDLPAPLEREVQLDLLGHRERKGSREHLEREAYKAREGRPERKEREELWGPQDLPALSDITLASTFSRLPTIEVL
jgi:hypothetical protein